MGGIKGCYDSFLKQTRMRIIAIQENEKTKKQSEDKITKAIKDRIVRDIGETF